MGRLADDLRDVSDAGTWPGKVARITRGAGTRMLHASLTHYVARRLVAWWYWPAMLLFGAGTIVSALFVGDAALNLMAPDQAGSRGVASRAAAAFVLVVLGGLVSFLVMAKVKSGS